MARLAQKRGHPPRQTAILCAPRALKVTFQLDHLMDAGQRAAAKAPSVLAAQLVKPGLTTKTLYVWPMRVM